MWSTYVGISWQLHDNYYEAVTIQFLFSDFHSFSFFNYYFNMIPWLFSSFKAWEWNVELKVITMVPRRDPPKRTRVVWWWWWRRRNSSTSLHYSIRLTAATLVITHFCEVSKYTTRARNTTNIFEYFLLVLLYDTGMLAISLT